MNAPTNARPDRIVVVDDDARIRDLLRRYLTQEGFDVLLAEVPEAEDAKRVEVAAFCWGIMGQADFTRSDAVISLGGGAATSLSNSSLRDRRKAHHDPVFGSCIMIVGKQSCELQHDVPLSRRIQSL